MRVQTTSLQGVLLLFAPVHEDSRGFFTELYRADVYAELGIGPFVQDNHSRSAEGVVRGLHWQRARPQGKLISVISGTVFDVVADVRPGSPTRGRWVAEQLSPGRQLWVPPGYAHGFCVLSEVAEVVYKCTEAYAAELACGVRYDDPALGIRWPVAAPRLSAADEQLPTLATLPPEHLP